MPGAAQSPEHAQHAGSSTAGSSTTGSRQYVIQRCLGKVLTKAICSDMLMDSSSVCVSRNQVLVTACVIGISSSWQALAAVRACAAALGLMRRCVVLSVALLASAGAGRCAADAVQ